MGGGTRRVEGLIDGPELYGSTVAAAGGYVFFGATAADESGQLASDAIPPEPYTGSPAAQAEAQGRQLFRTLDALLAKVGSSVGDIVQIEQYVQLKVHADPYFKIATSKDYLGKAVPVAATAQVGAHVPRGAAVAVTGIAIAPDEASGLVKAEPPDPTGAASANRRFSELVYAGPYAYTTIFPTDRKSGLPEAARTPEWIWSGSEIGAEMKWGIEELKGRLASVGADFSDIVDYTVFLTDTGDLYEFDQALKAAMGAAAPSRTVIPSRGFALPRREGAFGHADGAPRMEAQFRFRRPEGGFERTIVDGPGAGYGYQSAGVRLGPLLWLSSTVADSSRRGNARTEADEILGKLAQTCANANANTSLSDLLRVRVLLTDADDAAAVADALRAAVPNDPPAVCVAVLPAPLPAHGARVAIDGVAYVQD